ncbi:MAG: hypothetical protein ACLVIY_00700 [Anaerobutyricum soehngenii]
MYAWRHLLSLQNALSDYTLTKKTAAHTTQYYKAVNSAGTACTEEYRT